MIGWTIHQLMFLLCCHFVFASFCSVLAYWWMNSDGCQLLLLLASLVCADMFIESTVLFMTKPSTFKKMCTKSNPCFLPLLFTLWSHSPTDSDSGSGWVTGQGFHKCYINRNVWRIWVKQTFIIYSHLHHFFSVFLLISPISACQWVHFTILHMLPALSTASHSLWGIHNSHTVNKLHFPGGSSWGWIHHENHGGLITPLNY